MLVSTNLNLKKKIKFMTNRKRKCGFLHFTDFRKEIGMEYHVRCATEQRDCQHVMKAKGNDSTRLLPRLLLQTRCKGL